MNSPNAPGATSGWHLGLLTALLVVHAAETTWVALADRTPPYLAFMDHQARAELMLRELRSDHPTLESRAAGSAGSDRDERPTAPPLPAWLEPIAIVYRASGYRPPLPMIAALPTMVAFPESRSAGGIAGVMWMAILLASAYGIGCRVGDPTTGLVTAVILGALPGVLGHRALVLPFLPSAACVAATAHSLFALRAAERYAAARVGAWVGLAMLCRWDAVAPIAGLVGWYAVTTPRGTRWAAFWGAWPALPAWIVTAGWWYAWGTRLFVTFYLGQGILSTDHSHEGIPLFSLFNLSFYPCRFLDTLAGPLALPCGLAVFWLLRRRHPAAGLVAAWVGAALAFYLIVPMKAARYALPVLCPIALAVALAARAAGPKWTAGIVAWALVQHAILVHVPEVERTWNGARTDPRQWGERPRLWEFSQEVGRVRPWTDETWADTVVNVGRAIGAPFARPMSLLLADEGPAEYLASLECQPRLSLQRCSELPDTDFEPHVRAMDFIVLSTSPYVIAPIRDYAADRPERVRAAAAIEVALRTRLYVGSLPDGTRIEVYGRRR